LIQERFKSDVLTNETGRLEKDILRGPEGYPKAKGKVAVIDRIDKIQKCDLRTDGRPPLQQSRAQQKGRKEVGGKIELSLNRRS